MLNVYDVVVSFVVTTFALGLLVLSVTGTNDDRKAFRDLATVVVSMFVGSLTERAGSERKLENLRREQDLLLTPPPVTRDAPPDDPPERPQAPSRESPRMRPPS